jgi:hypothetical protein
MVFTFVICTIIINKSCIRFGRDSFQDAMKISHRMDNSLIDWSNFKYMVFDVPTALGTYEQRYSLLGIVVIFVLFILFCFVLFLFCFVLFCFVLFKQYFRIAYGKGGE